MTGVKDPWIIKDFFTEKKYNKIMSDINSIPQSFWFFEESQRRYVYQSDYFSRLSLLQLDRARSEFKSDSLLYSYSLLALYNRDDSNLQKHVDNNACTYTFDICLYSEKPWPLIVEDKEYNLSKNEALCFYGEDQFHYRPDFKKGNKVLMLFMHYAEPDHIFFQDPGEI